MQRMPPATKSAATIQRARWFGTRVGRGGAARCASVEAEPSRMLAPPDGRPAALSDWALFYRGLGGGRTMTAAPRCDHGVSQPGAGGAGGVANQVLAGCGSGVSGAAGVAGASGAAGDFGSGSLAAGL